MVYFFSISPLRLFLASLLSFGVSYDIYWAYKNWDAVRNYKKTPIFIRFFAVGFRDIFYLSVIFTNKTKAALPNQALRRIFCSVFAASSTRSYI